MSLIYTINSFLLTKNYLYFTSTVQKNYKFIFAVLMANNYHGGENLEEQLSEKELADLKAKELDSRVKGDVMGN